MFLDKFPQFKKHQVGINLYQLAEAADWTPGVNTDFTPEQKAELTKMKKQIASDRKQIAELDKKIAELKKEAALIKANNEALDRLSGSLSKTEERDN